MGILDRNGFEDLNILIYSKVWLKFAIVFKIFDICLFLSLMIITDQRNFSGLADGLLERTPETKN